MPCCDFFGVGGNEGFASGRPTDTAILTHGKMERDGHTTNEPTSTAIRVVCPTCKRPLRIPAEKQTGRPKFFPFCSERCKLVDLNAWLDADYRIEAKPNEESEDAMGGGEPSAS